MSDWRTGLIPLDDPQPASDWRAGLIPLDEGGPDFSPAAFDALKLPTADPALSAAAPAPTRRFGQRPEMPGPIPAGPAPDAPRSMFRRAPTGETFSQASIDSQIAALDNPQPAAPRRLGQSSFSIEDLDELQAAAQTGQGQVLGRRKGRVSADTPWSNTMDALGFQPQEKEIAKGRYATPQEIARRLEQATIRGDGQAKLAKLADGSAFIDQDGITRFKKGNGGTGPEFWKSMPAAERDVNSFLTEQLVAGKSADEARAEFSKTFAGNQPEKFDSKSYEGLAEVYSLARAFNAGGETGGVREEVAALPAEKRRVFLDALSRMPKAQGQGIIAGIAPGLARGLQEIGGALSLQTGEQGLYGTMGATGSPVDPAAASLAGRLAQAAPLAGASGLLGATQIASEAAMRGIDEAVFKGTKEQNEQQLFMNTAEGIRSGNVDLGIGGAVGQSLPYMGMVMAAGAATWASKGRATPQMAKLLGSVAQGGVASVLSGSSLYSQLRQDGVDPQIAQSISLIGGKAMGAVEQLEPGEGMGVANALGGLMQNLAKRTATKAGSDRVKQWVSDEVRSNLLQEAITTFAIEAGKGQLKELGEEAAQQTIEALGLALGNAMEGRKGGLGERFDTIVKRFPETAKVVALIGGAGLAGHVAADKAAAGLDVAGETARVIGRAFAEELGTKPAAQQAAAVQAPGTSPEAGQQTAPTDTQRPQAASSASDLSTPDGALAWAKANPEAAAAYLANPSRTTLANVTGIPRAELRVNQQQFQRWLASGGAPVAPPQDAQPAAGPVTPGQVNPDLAPLAEETQGMTGRTPTPEQRAAMEARQAPEPVLNDPAFQPRTYADFVEWVGANPGRDAEKIRGLMEEEMPGWQGVRAANKLGMQAEDAASKAEDERLTNRYRDLVTNLWAAYAENRGIDPGLTPPTLPPAVDAPAAAPDDIDVSGMQIATGDTPVQEGTKISQPVQEQTAAPAPRRFGQRTDQEATRQAGSTPTPATTPTEPQEATRAQVAPTPEPVPATQQQAPQERREDSGASVPSVTERELAEAQFDLSPYGLDVYQQRRASGMGHADAMDDADAAMRARRTEAQPAQPAATEPVDPAKPSQDDVQAAYEAHYPKVVNTLKRKGWSDADAEDAAADAFAKWIAKPESYDPAKGELSNWLTTVAERAATSANRKRKRADVELQEQGVNNDSPSKVAIARETVRNEKKKYDPTSFDPAEIEADAAAAASKPRRVIRPKKLTQAQQRIQAKIEKRQSQANVQDVQDAIEILKKSDVEAQQEREEVKAKVRKRTGINARHIAWLEEHGFDYAASATRVATEGASPYEQMVGNVRNAAPSLAAKLDTLNTTASEIQAEHPGFFEGDDPIKEIIKLLKEGRRPISKVQDSAVIDEAIDMVESAGKVQPKQPGEEEEFFRKRGRSKRNPHVPDVGQGRRPSLQPVPGTDTAAPSVAQIVKTVEEDMGFPIRSGKVPGQALGVWKVHPQVVRLDPKQMHPLETMTHEVAHGIDMKIDPTLLNNLTPAERASLEALDYDLARGDVREGFAEFMRLYMTQDPATAKKHGRAFNAKWEQWLKDHPRQAELIAKHRGMLDAYYHAGAQARVKGNLSFTGQASEAVRSSLKDWAEYAKARLRDAYETMRYRFGDDLMAAEKLDQMAAAKGTKAEAGAGVADVARAVMHAAPKYAETAILEGVHTISEKTGFKTIGPSLRDVYKDIPVAEYEDFVAWAYARHALEAHAMGKPPGISIEDAQTVYDAGKNNAHWVKAADTLRDFNNALVTMLWDAGVVDDKTLANILEEYDHYVPLMRAVDQRGGEIGKAVGSRSPLRRRFGNNLLEVMDPVQASMERAMVMYQAAARQQVINAIEKTVQQTKGMGELWEAIPPGREHTVIPLAEIKDQLEKAGLDKADLDALDPLTALSIWRPDYQPHGKNVVRVLVNGKPELRVVSPEIQQMLSALDKQTVQGWSRILVEAQKLVKAGATQLNPEFALANLFRDYQTYLLQTKEHRASDVAMPGRMVSALVYAAATGKPDVYKKIWKMLGGEMGTWLHADRPGAARNLRRLTGRGTLAERTADAIEIGLDGLEATIGFAETLPRLNELRKVLESRGWTRERIETEGIHNIPRAVLFEAINAAHDVTTDFRRGGAWIRMLNKYVPFLNARIQGELKFFRSLRERGLGVGLARAGAASMIGILQWWMWHDDDEYKERKEFERNYFYGKVGSQRFNVKIPLAHGGWGQIAKGAEALMGQLYDKDPSGTEAWVKQAFPFLDKEEAFDAFVSNLPPIIKEAAEVYANRSSFRKDPIISGPVAERKPEDQYTPWNDGLMRAIGKELGIAPAYLQHVADGLTGGLYSKGSRVVQGIGGALRGDSGRLGDALTTVSGVRSLMKTKDYSKSVDQFYDTMHQVEAEIASGELHLKEAAADPKLDPAKLDELAGEQERFKLRHRLLKGFADEMKELRKSRPDTVDREKLFEVDKQIVGLARQALGLEPLASYPAPDMSTDTFKAKMEALGAPRPKNAAKVGDWLADKQAAREYLEMRGVNKAGAMRRYSAWLKGRYKGDDTRDEREKRARDAWR